MESKSQGLIGTRLGTCTLKELIGSGGMGTVYLAQQTRPMREVAVKVLQPRIPQQAAGQQEFLARFRREADVIARLDHINILPVYEYGEQDGRAYLVIPYLSGGSLRDRLKRYGSLSLTETLTYIEQAASALDYAHAHNIIHRDIKPGNFLFHADGRLVLADFGIARIVRGDEELDDVTLTSAGQFLGSPEYMAPEMLHGEYVDQRADVYELGIVLFQMLSGHVPFQGKSLYAVAAMHLQEQAPLLSEMNPIIPRAVDDVIRKAIAKKREDRYMSTGELARALRAAIMQPQSDPGLMTLPAENPQYDPGSPVAQGNRPLVLQNYTPVPSTPVWSSTSPYDFQNLPQTPLPVTTQGTKRRFPWVGLLALILVATFLIGGAFFAFPFLQNIFQQPTSTTQGTPTTVPATAATSTPQVQAQAVIQQYFTDVNKQDYQDAYLQWGTDYQSTHTYDSFAQGYANTLHDDVIFHTITLQGDGTVKVDITLYATQQATGGGQTTQVFNGYYIVGQENGGWRLLTASLKPA